MYDYYGLQKLPYAMHGELWYVGLMNSGEMFLAWSIVCLNLCHMQDRYAGSVLAARPASYKNRLLDTVNDFSRTMVYGIY